MNLQTILRKIRRADQDYHLIEDGDVIGVGVSGGKDSMVLLCALQMYSRFRDKNFRVVGIHIEMGFPDMDFSQADARKSARVEKGFSLFIKRKRFPKRKGRCTGQRRFESGFSYTISKIIRPPCCLRALPPAR